MATNQPVITHTGYQAEAMDVRGGNKYITVAQRVQEAHHAGAYEPGYSIVRSEPLTIGDNYLWQVEIVVSGCNFTGTASINFGGKGADQTNPVENAETSALGRALGFAGFGSIESIASADEVYEAKRRQAAGYQSQAPKPKLATEQQLTSIQQLAGQASLTGVEFAAWLRDSYQTSWSRLTFDTADQVIAGLQELVTA